MTHKELLKKLVSVGLEPVLIGGTSLRIYNSPRVTHDIDLAIRASDIDNMVRVMYADLYFLVKAVSDESCFIALTSETALAWIEKEKVGSVSFVQTEVQPEEPDVDHSRIIISSQVDFLFELPIPYPRLKQRARRIRLDDLTFLVAAPADLLRLKEARPDKDATDLEDIRFLKHLLESGD